MRNIAKKRISLLTIVTSFLIFILLLIYCIISLAKNNANYFSIASLLFSIITFIIGLKKTISTKIIYPDKYQIDIHFVDREKERQQLSMFVDNAFDNSKNINRVCYVTGSAGIGKTLLLREFADDINNMKTSILKSYRKRSVYYIYFDRKGTILQNCCSQLGLKDLPCSTSQQFSKSLMKSSVKQKAILIIDNLDKSSFREARDFSTAICYNNKNLVVILGITKASGNNAEIIPRFFYENELMLLERSFNKTLTANSRKDIIKSSHGLPAYVRFLFRMHINDDSFILSNKEEIREYINDQIQHLEKESRYLLSILSFRKAIKDEPIAETDLFKIIRTGTRNNIEQLLDSSLIVQNKLDNKVDMESLIAEECRILLNSQRSDCFHKIYLFYKNFNKECSTAVAALLLSDCAEYDINWVQWILTNQFDNNQYYFLASLGDFDQIAWLNPSFIEQKEIYNEFRYYYLESLLQLGQYPQAYNALVKYDMSPVPMPPVIHCKTDFEFSVQYLIADLNHLSNHFLSAIENASMLEYCISSEEHKNKCRYLIAHCTKHIGEDLQLADRMLISLTHNTKSISAELTIKVLYSRISIHLFWNDLTFNYKSYFNNINKIISNSAKKLSAKENVKRHLAIYYLKIHNDPGQALDILMDTLSILEVTQQRIKYDFYFEIAELMRIQNEVEFAKNDSAIIKQYYNEAITFAQEVNDYNLFSCSVLGKILLELRENSYHRSEWLSKSLSTVQDILKTTKEYDLYINSSYAQLINYILSKEKIPQEALDYWEKVGYSDMLRAANAINKNEKFVLKLTVM